MNRILIASASILTLALIAAAAGLVWLSSSLKTDFQNRLSQALDADVHFADIKIHPFSGTLEAREGQFTPNHPSSCIWQQLKIQRVKASFSLSDLFATPIPIEVTVESASMLLRESHSTGTATGTALSASIPTNLTQEQGGEASWPQVRIRSIRFVDLAVASPTPGSFSATAIQGSLQAGVDPSSWSGSFSCPSMQVDTMVFSDNRATIQIFENKIQIESFLFKCQEGFLSGNALWNTQAPANSSIHLDFKQLPVSTLIPSKWQVLLSGLASGSGEYTGPFFQWKEGSMQGSVSLDQAKLQSLPFTKKLSAFPGLNDLASISLDSAQSDMQYEQGSYRFSNLDLSKTGKIRIGGTCTINPEGQLDGDLKLGLPENTLSLWPGLKEDIFKTSSDGYAWADVKLSGTPEHWNEDLSPRIAALAQSQGSSLIEQGAELLQKGKEKATELLDLWLKE